MNLGRMTLAALSCAAFSAVANPLVSDVTMTQNDSSRLVTVRYKLENGPAIITFDVQTNGVSIGGVPLAAAQGDVFKEVSGDGYHEITWDPVVNWNGNTVTDHSAHAVVSAWTKANPPDYVVMDLLPESTQRLRYYPGEDFLPGGLLGEASPYRTTMLVMRRINAKGVLWTMGTDSENGRVAADGAAHQVQLNSNYYIGVFPFTQKQFQLVFGVLPNGATMQFQTQCEKRPLDNIYINLIRTFKGLLKDEGKPYLYPNDPHPSSVLGLLRTLSGSQLEFDLPSEAQWEFAACAGDGEGYWGNGTPILATSTSSTAKDENLSKYARYSGNGGTLPSDMGKADAPVEYGTPEVGSYDSNNWGLYDMCGGMWELCLDWYQADITQLNGAPNINGAKLADGTAATSDTKIVRRGGTYANGPSGCRPRSRSSVGQSATGVGFRLVAEIH